MAENYEKEIRKRIERRYNKRKEFFALLFTLSILNIGIWSIFSPAGLFLTAAQCFLGISILAVVLTGGEYLFNELKENAIDREIEREREARYGGYRYTADKTKREYEPPVRLVTLSEDGELVDMDDDDEHKTPRRRRK